MENIIRKLHELISFAQNRRVRFKVNTSIIKQLLKIQYCVVLCYLLSSCATHYGIAPKDIDDVRNDKKAIVLFNIQCTIDGTQYQVFRRQSFSEYMSEDKSFFFGLGSFETAGIPKRFRFGVSFISEQLKNEGWAYFLVPPGIYYFAAIGPGSIALAQEEYFQREAPRWRINIPEKTDLIYIGTLLMKGHIDGELMFGGKFYRPANYQDIKIRDDQLIASDIFKQHFSTLDEMRVILMERWHAGEPLMITTPK